MKLVQLFKAFSSDENGAVTVDWVVLTAAIVGLGMVVMGSVGTGIETMGSNIAGELDDADRIGYENAPAP